MRVLYRVFVYLFDLKVPTRKFVMELIYAFFFLPFFALLSPFDFVLANNFLAFFVSATFIVMLTYFKNVNEHFRFLSQPSVAYLQIKMENHTPKQGLINIQS